MNALMKKLLSMALMLLLSTGAFGADKFSLDDLKNEVMTSNLDIQVQYENYYQAQKGTRNSLGEFLPNLTLTLLFWNTSYALLYAVLPNPSSWFEYRGSKELGLAEKYVTETVRLNILNDLALSYVNIKHQEKILESLEAEEGILAAAYEQAQNRDDLGVGDPSATFAASRTLLQHRQEILMLKSVIAIEKEGLLLAINKNPTDKIELADLPEITEDLIPQDLEEGIYTGIENSPELTANRFMAEGAKYMVRSARWSFIGFSGIGFGYPSKVAIERSNARVIDLKGAKIVNKIENQIALAYEERTILDERIEIQKEILENAIANHLITQDLFRGAAVSEIEVFKAEREVFDQERRLITLKMQRMGHSIKMKRLLGYDATVNELSTEEIAPEIMHVAVNNLSFGKKKISVSIEVPEALANEVVSVTYEGDVFDMRIPNNGGNYNLFTKFKGSGEKLVKANLLLTNGEIVTLEKVITL